eukprot:scaffold15873_cov65-Cyclotella_meneghiniana.AAC.2
MSPSSKWYNHKSHSSGVKYLYACHLYEPRPYEESVVPTTKANAITASALDTTISSVSASGSATMPKGGWLIVALKYPATPALVLRALFSKACLASDITPVRASHGWCAALRRNGGSCVGGIVMMGGGRSDSGSSEVVVSCVIDRDVRS